MTCVMLTLKMVANVLSFPPPNTPFVPLSPFCLPVRFRSKYHPDEAGRRKAEAHSALQNRLNVYMYLMDNNSFESVSLDIEHAPQITKILDAGIEKCFLLARSNFLKSEKLSIGNDEKLAIFSKHVFRLSMLAVIKMEGGTENDLRILEQPNEEEEERERLSSGGPGSEPPKRDEPRPVDVERKPSTEKDKMVSECCIME